MRKHGRIERTRPLHSGDSCGCINQNQGAGEAYADKKQQGLDPCLGRDRIKKTFAQENVNGTPPD